MDVCYYTRSRPQDIHWTPRLPYKSFTKTLLSMVMCCICSIDKVSFTPPLGPISHWVVFENSTSTSENLGSVAFNLRPNFPASSFPPACQMLFRSSRPGYFAISLFKKDHVVFHS
jgi:hypothetical protein